MRQLHAQATGAFALPAAGRLVAGPDALPAPYAGPVPPFASRPAHRPGAPPGTRAAAYCPPPARAVRSVWNRILASTRKLIVSM